MLIALILASGKGTRLAPLSTEERPKQYLSLITENTLVEDTVNRVINFIEPKNIFVVTNIAHESIVSNLFTNLPKQNIILEPFMKETLASISHATAYISKIIKEEFQLVILPSDHYIDDLDEFELSIKDGLKIQENNLNHVLYGVKPTYASTEYGYIETTKGTTDLRVTNFIEKPVADVANELIKHDNYYWNNGIMLSTKSLILDSIKNTMNTQYNLIEDFINNKITTEEFFTNTYVGNFSRSILENQSNMNFLEAKYLWYDVGGYDALFEILEKLKLQDKLDSIKEELSKFN